LPSKQTSKSRQTPDKQLVLVIDKVAYRSSSLWRIGRDGAILAYQRIDRDGVIHAHHSPPSIAEEQFGLTSTGFPAFSKNSDQVHSITLCFSIPENKDDSMMIREHSSDDLQELW
jgi:hypothetical protein